MRPSDWRVKWTRSSWHLSRLVRGYTHLPHFLHNLYIIGHFIQIKKYKKRQRHFVEISILPPVIHSLPKSQPKLDFSPLIFHEIEGGFSENTGCELGAGSEYFEAFDILATC